MVYKKNYEKKAVALGYKYGESAAPVVLASGKGEIAKKIIELAEQYEVPFYKDSGLVDSLVELRLNEEIPIELYQAIAHVLAFVYAMDQKKLKN